MYLTQSSHKTSHESPKKHQILSELNWITNTSRSKITINHKRLIKLSNCNANHHQVRISTTKPATAAPPDRFSSISGHATEKTKSTLSSKLGTFLNPSTAAKMAETKPQKKTPKTQPDNEVEPALMDSRESNGSIKRFHIKNIDTRKEKKRKRNKAFLSVFRILHIVTGFEGCFVLKHRNICDFLRRFKNPPFTLSLSPSLSLKFPSLSGLSTSPT